MTIRFTCPDCQSTLKIRDEKAGTDAKCPKCKRPFVVPQPDTDDGIEIEEPRESALPPATVAPIELPVDMPIDLTPEVASQTPFDPADFLASTPAAPRNTPASTPASASARKPSVAELMKDFENTKKSKERDKGRKTTDTPRPTATAAETTGSAADALARAYQQKRDNASAAPALTKDDARAQEQRTVAINFLKTKLIPGLAALFIVGYAWSWYINREIYEGPPLFEVSGTVLQDGKPLANATVDFAPSNPTPQLRSSLRHSHHRRTRSLPPQSIRQPVRRTSRRIHSRYHQLSGCPGQRPRKPRPPNCLPGQPQRLLTQLLKLPP